MTEWKVIWLPPVDGGNFEDFKIVLEKFKGVYIWKHKPTDQVVYIGESGKSFYYRVFKTRINGQLRKGKGNIYDFEKEPDFARLLKRYSFNKTYMEINKTEMIFVPNQQASEIWNRCWQPKIDDYIYNLQFLFCTGEWSSDKDNRRHVESLLLWKYKKYYAKRAGLPTLEKDNHHICIGKIQDPGLKGITFKHIGCVESVPEKVLETLK